MNDQTRRDLCGGIARFQTRRAPNGKGGQWRLSARRKGVILALDGQSQSLADAGGSTRDGLLYLDELIDLLRQAGRELFAGADPAPVVRMRPAEGEEGEEPGAYREGR